MTESLLPDMLRVRPWNPELLREAEQRNREAWGRSTKLHEEARYSQTRAALKRRAELQREEERRALEAVAAAAAAAAAAAVSSREPARKPKPKREEKAKPLAWFEKVPIEEVEAWRAQGATYVECAERLGVSRSTFADWFARNSKTVKKREIPEDWTREEVLKIYHEEYAREGVSLQSLSIPRTLAGRLFKRENLPLKNARGRLP